MCLCASYDVGGVRKDMYNFLPRQIQSRHGFEGCLASLDLNGESPDTTLDALVPSPLVVPGCEGEKFMAGIRIRNLMIFF